LRMHGVSLAGDSGHKAAPYLVLRQGIALDSETSSEQKAAHELSTRLLKTPN
jgi:hypothetical protein